MIATARVPVESREHHDVRWRCAPVGTSFAGRGRACPVGAASAWQPCRPHVRRQTQTPARPRHPCHQLTERVIFSHQDEYACLKHRTGHEPHARHKLVNDGFKVRKGESIPELHFVLREQVMRQPVAVDNQPERRPCTHDQTHF